jgi:hypothetical protein
VRGATLAPCTLAVYPRCMAAKRAPKRPPAKVTPTGLVNVNLRIPVALLASVDARVKVANDLAGWNKLTRTDWMRDALAEAVARDAGPPGGSRSVQR